MSHTNIDQVLANTALGEAKALAGLKAVATFSFDIDCRKEFWNMTTHTWGGFHIATFHVKGEKAIEVSIPIDDALATPHVWADRPLVESR